MTRTKTKPAHRDFWIGRRFPHKDADPKLGRDDPHYARHGNKASRRMLRRESKRAASRIEPQILDAQIEAFDERSRRGTKWGRKARGA